MEHKHYWIKVYDAVIKGHRNRCSICGIYEDELK